MNVFEFNQLKSQLECLLTIQEEYPGKTIDNIIDNIKARIKWAKENGVGNVPDKSRDNKGRTPYKLFDETMEYPASMTDTHPLP